MESQIRLCINLKLNLQEKLINEIINGSDARINFNVDYGKKLNEIINGSDTRINFNVVYSNYNIKHLDIQLNKELLAEEMDD